MARFCEVLTKAALAHVEHAVAGMDWKPGDPIFERKQMALNVEAIVKQAMLTGFAAADAAHGMATNPRTRSTGSTWTRMASRVRT